MTANLGEFGAVIFCDDVRREITNKDILIGVYGTEIVVVGFPHTVTLAIYLEYFPRRTGDEEFFLKLEAPGRGSSGILTIRFRVEHEGPVPIVIPGVQITFVEPGELSLDASADQAVWTRIKRRRVVQGSVRSLPAPTLLRSAPTSG
jgi:hypothetical protein